jgi:WD40 repeat protein
MDALGKRIVSGSDDRTARVWDAETGAEVTIFKGHTGRVRCVGISADGTRAVSSAETDPRVRVWETRTGQEIRTFNESSASVALSPDGSRVCTGCSPAGSITVWDVGMGAQIFAFRRSRSGIGKSVCYTADGKRIAAGGLKLACVLDADTGKELITVSHAGFVSSLCFSRNGLLLATGSTDQTAKVWDTQGGVELMTFPHPGRVSCVSFSPDGTRLATSSTSVKVWDASLPRHHSWPQLHHFVLLSADGSLVAGLTAPGNVVNVWNSSFERPPVPLRGHTTKGISCATFSPDSKRLATGGIDTTVKVWDARTGKEQRTFRGHDKAVVRVVFGPDGRQIASSTLDRIVLWDAETGQEKFTFRQDFLAFGGIAVSPDGLRLASSINDQTLKVWDTRTGKEIHSFNERGREVSFTPDGKKLLLWGGGNVVKVLDAETGMQLLLLKGHTQWTNSACVSSDGTRIVTSSRDGTAKLWDAETGLEVLSLKGSERELNGVCLSPDGRCVYGLTHEGQLRLWEADPGNELRVLKAHPVSCTSFSGDGKLIVTGASDGSVKAWSAKTGQELASHRGHAAAVVAVSFNDDAGRLVSRDARGKTVVWDIEAEKVLPDAKDTGSPPRHESPDGKWKLVLDGNVVKVERK